MLPFGLSRSAALVLGVTVLGVLALLGHRLASTGTATAPARAAPLRAGRDVSSSTSQARLVVHVVGAVQRPGLYRLADGARVADALRRAGGPTRKADLAAVNLAQPLADGVQVILPIRGPAGAAASSSGGQGAKVHLSTATAAELDELPGVGPVTAEKIVAWRQTHGAFRTIDELDAIPGIGPARVEQLRELATP